MFPFSSPSSFHLSRSRRTFLLESRFAQAMAQGLIRHSLIAEVRFQSQISSCDTYGGQSGSVTGLSNRSSVIICQYILAKAPFLSST